MSSHADVLTTGQVAKICNVAPRTVSKWFDSGQLRGYRIPGSKDRRIPRDQLLRFMKAHGIPMDGIESGTIRVLLIDPDQAMTRLLKHQMEAQQRFEVCVAGSIFAAGILASKYRPHAIVIDVVSFAPEQVAEIALTLRSCDELETARLIAIGANLSQGRGQQLLRCGYEAYQSKPFHSDKLIQMIDDATAIVS